MTTLTVTFYGFSLQEDYLIKTYIFRLKKVLGSYACFLLGLVKMDHDELYIYGKRKEILMHYHGS